MAGYYIGYDCGTMGTKVAIYSLKGDLISEAYREHLIKYPRPGWAEMDPEQFYRCVTEGIKECMQRSRLRPADIKGISNSGIISGYVPIDDDWQPVAPYIPYLDNRAVKEAQYLKENAEPVWIEEAGYSMVSGYMPPMILKWFQNNDRPTFSSIKKALAASQFVLGRLGGLKAKDAFMDWGHMSGWVLGFCLESWDWSEKQWKIFGLPFDILPKVVRPWEVVGYLTKEEAAKIDLVEGIPLIAGCGDIMQSNLGAGVTENGACSDIAGTASIFTVLLGGDTKKITDTVTLRKGFSTLEGQYIYFGAIPAGGLSLRWFRDEILREPGDTDSYDRMNKLAEVIPIGSDGVLYFPFLQGRCDPYWENASGALLGLYGSNGIANLYKSMMESIAFEYLFWTGLFRSQGIDIKSTTIIGGGAKSDMWNQIKADILNTPCKTLKRTDSGALGNALLAAYGAGDVSDLAGTIKKWIETKKVYEPIKSNHEAYINIFKARQKILNGPLKEIFDILDDLRNSLS